MNKINFQNILDKIIQKHVQNGEVPSLLLHSCCAPCSSYSLEYLSKYFRIFVYYYNPNIYPESEYFKRVEEQKKFIQQLPVIHPISFIEGEYQPKEFYEIAKGLEKEPEGGIRCFECYRLRLKKTAQLARQNKIDYFTTTLSISPLKNAAKINEIGNEISEIYHVQFLPSDFKKRGGYLRSIELSKEYGLYRQNYCGCIYSIREKEENNK